MKVAWTGVLCAAMLAGLSGPHPRVAWSDETSSPLAHALRSVFNPQLAPPKKSMGLLQRSFLELVESSSEKLEVALVVDGTESMGADLDGVKSTLRFLVDDLGRYRRNQVAFALVVYRDVGAKSGKVSVPVARFTSRPEVLEAAWQSIQPETGAPFFPELIDLGVHTALEKLNWSDDPETTRWALVFGDAPPFDLGTADAETGAERLYDTEQLVALATRKNVKISGILCTCREEEQASYEAVLDKTRRFMNSLASGTGGSMLDLSYPDIRDALLATAAKPRVSYQHVGVIKREDVEAARVDAEQKQTETAQSARVRVAVLPHLAWERMTLDPENDAVRLATELRQKFRSIPRVEVKSPVDIERQIQRLKGRGTTPDQWLQALAIRLRVDYIIWGDFLRAGDTITVSSGIFSQGKKLVEVGPLSGDDVQQVAAALMGRAAASRDPNLANVFRQFRNDPKLQAEIISSLSENSRSRQHILTAFDLLEQALAHEVTSERSKNLLDQSEQQLGQSLQFDKTNSMAQLLLANCCFNQAQFYVNIGERDQAEGKVEQYKQALERAFQERDRVKVESVRLEILADYNLMHRKDYAKAVKYYHQLADAPRATGLHTMLRAHWMLAGIYGGDWGAGEQIVDADRARLHLVQILAHWDDSREAQYVKNNLRWNDEEGENQFEYLPANALAGLF